MDKIGIRFGNAAVYMVVAYLLQKQDVTEENWKKCIRIFLKEDCYVNKGCPKNTFLGLCSQGYLNCIPSGSYLNSNSIETEYAKIAIHILTMDEKYADTPRKLWKKVLDVGNFDLNKNYDFQMDIVCALWNAGFISKQD